MSRLTDTQLIILSAASQRDDRGLKLPVVGKLIRAGLVEEVRAGGALPVWRRDDETGPMALRITQQGLKSIDVEDEATVRPVPIREAETPPPEAIASKRVSVAAQKSARKKHRPGKAKTKVGSPRQREPAFDPHVLALDIASILEALPERAQTLRGRFKRSGVEEADHRHRRLLGSHGERPRRRAALQLANDGPNKGMQSLFKSRI